MLAIIYLIEKKAKGVKSAILSSTLSSSKLWASEQHRMIKLMSEEDQRAIAEAKGDFSSEAYAKANEYTPTGTLRDYDYTDRLREIQVPCMVYVYCFYNGF